jgi:small-conductance mechanosensitive channel
MSFYSILFITSFFIYPLFSQQIEIGEIKDTTNYDILLVSKITTNADKVRQILKKINKDLRVQEEIEEIEKKLPSVIDSLNTLHTDSLHQYFATYYIRSLQSMQQEWTVYSKKLNEWKILVKDRTKLLEKNKKEVQSISNEWEITEKSAAKSIVPANINTMISSIKYEIDTVKNHLQKRINTLLVLQNQIFHQKVNMDELILQISEVISKKRSKLFIIDQPPLWVSLWGDENIAIGEKTGDSWDDFLKILSSFVKANKSQLYLHLVLLIAIFLLLLYFYYLNKQQNLFDKGDEVLKASAYFISRPISAAFLIAIFLSVIIYPNATVTIGELVIVIILIPMQRLISGAIVAQRKKSVHILSVLFFIVFIINNIVGYMLLQRILLLLISITTMQLFIGLIKETHPLHKQNLKPWPKIIFFILPLIVFLLAISITANIVGSLALSLLLTEGVIKSIMVGVILYTTARVLDGLVILSIRKRIKRSSHFVQAYSEKLEHWSVIFIHFIAFIVWLRAIFRAFRLLQTLQEWFMEIMATQWAFGSFILSVQNIFDFFLILVSVFALSKLIRIVLDVEVFSRIHLPRGIPGAISMIVRYTIVGVGIFLAISSLGVDLSTFGLLAGTLGVGLGFGLQNVIANFVSGLILTFERPIQVGDKIEVGEVLGNVKQIGVRSSTVRTFDGSEVIVPNADLISNQVVNWTLTDRKQRMKLAVKVAFESDPNQVLEILLKVAKEHSNVLNDPEPIATFNGFGDYYLDFTLYYWITSEIFKTKSEVALAIHGEIKDAGINKPKPQQEIKIMLSEDSQGIKVVDQNSSVKKKR